MTSNIRLTFLALMLLAYSACSDRKESKKLEAPVNPPPPAGVAATPTQDRSGCPANGLWAVCSVEKRLKQSGFVAQKNDSSFPKRAGFTVKPEIYTLNHSRLELYFYPDATALDREMARVDTAAAAPVFIRAGNLAALFFTDDARQAERLSLALTAGAPQPVR
jgi:hypothetical protein